MRRAIAVVAGLDPRPDCVLVTGDVADCGLVEEYEADLQLIARGLSTPDIAEQLFISQKTLKNHLASIYNKLDARDRTHAVILGVKRGIVDLN